MTNTKTTPYEEFARMASDSSLSKYEKIGFEDSLRRDRERDILEDILAKLPSLTQRGTSLLDIGCGCSDLPLHLIEHAKNLNQTIVLSDSREMLDQLPDSPSVSKIVGQFPEDWQEIHLKLQFDSILVYSVIQYVFQSGSLFKFLDNACAMLKPGGRLLIGDIPNATRRQRFLASPSGVAFHRAHYQTQNPHVAPFQSLFGEIDDATVLGIVSRYRAFGYDAWIVPQNNRLPMSNRREDILIERFL